jgi:hypothetical protein
VTQPTSPFFKELARQAREEVKRDTRRAQESKRSYVDWLYGDDWDEWYQPWDPWFYKDD